MPEPIVVPPNTIIKFPDKPEQRGFKFDFDKIEQLAAEIQVMTRMEKLEGKEFLNWLLNKEEL
jgi:hypothetical protein